MRAILVKKERVDPQCERTTNNNNMYVKWTI